MQDYPSASDEKPRADCYHCRNSQQPAPIVSLERLQSFLADDMRAVDHVIRQSLYSDVVLIRQVSEYIIISGGMRLRPALVLLSAGCFNYSGSALHDLAAVV